MKMLCKIRAPNKKKFKALSPFASGFSAQTSRGLQTAAHGSNKDVLCSKQLASSILLLAIHK